MIKLTKIRAGALQFVLFIGAIIAVLLMAFVMLSHSHTLFNKKTDINIELIQATDKGMTRSFEQSLEAGKAWSLPEENTMRIQTNVEKSYWGILEKRAVVSKKGKLMFTKIGLVGHQEVNRFALYLQDDNRPMVIAGDAKINGDAYLPERGIKMGNIQGYGYTKPQLVYGREWQSKSRLPELENGVVGQLKQLTGTGYMPTGDVINFNKEAIVKNSFQKETQIIRGTVVNLVDVSLTGNIMVWASQQINVRPTANLRDIVLVAPKINIADGVTGNFQALASKQIKVGRNCTLNYPSVLAVQEARKFEKDNNILKEPSFIMESGSSVSGMILYKKDNESKGYGADLKIDKNASVHGEIYCDGSLELKGGVYGSVLTQSFISMENGNVYLNHLYNGNINSNQLPIAFGGLVFVDKPVNQVMKWLY